jgi:hypothetical protein
MAGDILTDSVRVLLQESWNSIDEGVEPPRGVSKGLITIYLIPGTDSIAILNALHIDCGCRDGIMDVSQYSVDCEDFSVKDNTFFTGVIVSMYPRVPMTVLSVKKGGDTSSEEEGDGTVAAIRR